jgi:hypothetical protein
MSQQVWHDKDSLAKGHNTPSIGLHFATLHRQWSMWIKETRMGRKGKTIHQLIKRG